MKLPPQFGGNQWMQMSSEFEGFPLDFPYNQALFGLASFFGRKWPLASLPQILKRWASRGNMKKPISSCWNRSKRMKLIALGFWVSYKCTVLTFFGCELFPPEVQKSVCICMHVCFYYVLMINVFLLKILNCLPCHCKRTNPDSTTNRIHL